MIYMEPEEMFHIFLISAMILGKWATSRCSDLSNTERARRMSEIWSGLEDEQKMKSLHSNALQAIMS
jgi:hypothetical protein